MPQPGLNFLSSLSGLLKMFTKENIRNIKTISIHVLIWALVLATNFIFLESYVFNFDFTFHVLTWIVYISLFYLNYSLLVPVFLFRRKIYAYVAGSLILLSGAYLINKELARNQFITVIKQMEGPAGIHSPLPDEFQHDPVDFRRFPPQFDREVLRRPELENMLRGGRPPGPGPLSGRILYHLSGLLLLFLASTSTRVLLKFRDDEKKQDEITKERISTELLYLKQQINPHFLFNTLNNLYALSIKAPGITPEAILKVSSILRYTLYKSDNSPALLTDEIDIINAYIDIQRMRSKNSLPVSFNLTGDIDKYKIEPFILIPLVENAFKYGMADINDSFIDVQITIINDKLKFRVENKKSPVKESDPDHSGIGLKNIQRRLDLVYPGCHEFKIENNDETFTVFLEVPLNT